MRTLFAPIPSLAFATIEPGVPATSAVLSYRTRARSWRDAPVWPALALVWLALFVSFFASLA